MSGGRVELGLGAGWFDGRAHGVRHPVPADAHPLRDARGSARDPHGDVGDARGRALQLRRPPAPRRVDSPGLPKPAQRPATADHHRGPRGEDAPPAWPLVTPTSSTCRFAARGLPPGLRRRPRRVRGRRARSGVVALHRRPHGLRRARTMRRCNAAREAIGQHPDALRKTAAAGTPAEVIDRLHAFAGAGAETVYLQVLDLHDLDHLHLIAAEVAAACLSAARAACGSACTRGCSTRRSPSCARSGRASKRSGSTGSRSGTTSTRPTRPATRTVSRRSTTHTALAASTTRVTCGSLVYSAGYRHPAVLANAMATLDEVADGRVVLRLGRGLAPARVRRVRPALRHRRRAPAHAGGVHPVRARAAHPGAHDVRRRVLPPARRAVRAQAGAGAVADLDRRRRREGDVAHRGAARRRLERAVHPARCVGAQGRACSTSTANGSGAIRRRSRSRSTSAWRSATRSCSASSARCRTTSSRAC